MAVAIVWGVRRPFGPAADATGRYDRRIHRVGLKATVPSLYSDTDSWGVLFRSPRLRRVARIVSCSSGDPSTPAASTPAGPRAHVDESAERVDGDGYRRSVASLTADSRGRRRHLLSDPRKSVRQSLVNQCVSVSVSVRESTIADRVTDEQSTRPGDRFRPGAGARTGTAGRETEGRRRRIGGPGSTLRSPLTATDDRWRDGTARTAMGPRCPCRDRCPGRRSRPV